MNAWRFGSVLDFNSLLTVDDSAQIRLTYFYNRGKNEIFKRRGVYCREMKDTGNNSICPVSLGNNRNLPGYTIQGFELEGNYDSKYWFAGLSLST